MAVKDWEWECWFRPVEIYYDGPGCWGVGLCELMLPGWLCLMYESRSLLGVTRNCDGWVVDFCFIHVLDTIQVPPEGS